MSPAIKKGKEHFLVLIMAKALLAIFLSWCGDLFEWAITATMTWNTTCLLRFRGMLTLKIGMTLVANRMF